MTEPRTIVASVEESIAHASKVAACAGAEAVELTFTDDDRPGAVRWTFAVTFPDSVATGTAVTPPGGSHSRSICYAVARCMESLGAAYTIVDAHDAPEPTR